MNYHRKLFLLIAVSTLCRLAFASTIELSNAEVYYWAFSLKPQWNYFDHPPIVAWLIRLTTANLLLHKEVFVRLGAIISSAVCTWLMFTIGKVIKNETTGWYAAVLHTASVYGSLLAGTFILPDSPQMVFWLCSILILFKISKTPVIDRKSILLWCLFGLSCGLCVMSKVHGLFLWVGAILFVVFDKKSWLTNRGIYLGAFITLIVISPIIIWNIQNHFVTYHFHTNRITPTAAGIQSEGFIKAFLQVIFVVNPVNFFLIAVSLVKAFQRKLEVDKRVIHIVLYTSLPLIILLLLISLFRETLAHWPQPAYLTLLLLPAVYLETINQHKKRLFPVILKVALTIVIIIGISENLVTNYFPGTTSLEKGGLQMGEGDVTLDMYGWQAAGQKFKLLYKDDVAKQVMPVNAPIIVTSWFPAAHIDYYFAYQAHQSTIGIGSILDLHQYFWMNKYKQKLNEGDSAYFIIPSNLFDSKKFNEVSNHFNNFELAETITEFRSGIMCKQVFIFRLKGYRK